MNEKLIKRHEALNCYRDALLGKDERLLFNIMLSLQRYGHRIVSLSEEIQNMYLSPDILEISFCEARVLVNGYNANFDTLKMLLGRRWNISVSNEQALSKWSKTYEELITLGLIDPIMVGFDRLSVSSIHNRVGIVDELLKTHIKNAEL